MILYALTHGFLDNIPVESLAKYEESLYIDMKTSEEGKKLVETLRLTKTLPDSAKMDAYLTEFNKKFM